MISALVVVVLLTAMGSQAASAVSPRDFKPGRIIDDSIFYNKSAMNGVQAIQNFLNTHVPVCDTWGTGSSGHGNLTRAQYAQQMGWHAPPYACLQNYHENPATGETSFEKGGGGFAGGQSAAQIIWDASQEYGINPQVLLVMLRKESAGPLTADNWPLKTQYKYAMGYGCPDSGPNYSANCSSAKAGFYNQMRLAAWQLRYYANNINTYNYRPYRNNYIQHNPDPACGGKNVYIENVATASLYIYTPYVPNDGALDAYPGSASCGAYGNRNFFMMFSDWFGSTQVYDPYGWNLVKTSTDSKVYLVVGNTKRWVPSGELFDDWNLDIKPVQTVSQSELDAIPTIPQLDRLGLYNNRYYYVDGGKRYWLSNDALLRAWGQADKLAIASPAYIPLSTIPDGGEATFYTALPSESKVARMINGQRYMINAGDADRWQANPTILSTSAFNSTPVAATLDYRVSVNGIKYLVDNGRMINVNSAASLRDYSQTSANFVGMPDEILSFLRPQDASSLVGVYGENAVYVLRSGQKYYIPTINHARAWNVQGNPTMISSRLGSSLPTAENILPNLIRTSDTGKAYLLDGTKHELSGSMLDSANAASLPQFTSDQLKEIPSSNVINSPIIRTREQGAIFNMDNGRLYHIPSGSVLNALGYPRKYQIEDISKLYTDVAGLAGGMSMFINVGSNTYFLQDGNAFPIESNALSDWTSGSSIPTLTSSNLTTRFDFHPSYSLGTFVQEGQDRYILSGGSAKYAGPYSDEFLPAGAAWKPIAIFGIPRSNLNSILARPANLNDNRIFLIFNGTKQHILTGEAYNALSKKGDLQTIGLSDNVLNSLPQVNLGKEVSPLVYTSGKGFKLLGSNGLFYGFADGDTLTSFASGNQNLDIDDASFSKYTQFAGNVTRLIKDPSGKVFWVESGKKRWITNGRALQQYTNTPMTAVTYQVTSWLTDGLTIE